MIGRHWKISPWMLSVVLVLAGLAILGLDGIAHRAQAQSSDPCGGACIDPSACCNGTCVDGVTTCCCNGAVAPCPSNTCQ
jgi:hypothetical protein